eukprot:63991-Hanusia_phi.AAC.1
MYPSTEEGCPFCSRHAEFEAENAKQIRASRADFRKRVKAVFEGNSIKLKTDQNYFLISTEWVDHFKDWVQVSEIQDLRPIDNSPLLVPEDAEESERGKLLYDPSDFSQPDLPYIWATEDDWKTLQEHAGGGPAIMVTPILNQSW